MVEIRGREIRLSHTIRGSIELKVGQRTNLIGGEFYEPSDTGHLRISSESVFRYLKSNDVIYFDDGKVVGIVEAVQGTSSILTIKIGGIIKPNCQVKFVNGKHSNEVIIRKEDLTDLSAISHSNTIDFLSIPFVTSPEDITNIREVLGPNSKSIKIFAKIDQLDGL